MNKTQKAIKILTVISVVLAIMLAMIIVPYIIEQTGNKQNTDETTTSQVQTSQVETSQVTTSEVQTSQAEQTTTTPVELTAQEKKQYVLDHPEQYTEALIEFINKYDQVIDYVYNYKDRDSLEVSGNTDGYQTQTAFPLYIQWDARWGYSNYGTSIIGIAGCGPSALAMVYQGLTGNTDQNPATVCAMSENNGYYVAGSGTSWELMTKGAKDLGLNSQEIPLYESRIIQELSQGRAVICNVREGDFTKSGHYIVITGYNDGKFIINDSNSIENSSKLWEYSVLEPQIKNLWSFWK